MVGELDKAEPLKTQVESMAAFQTSEGQPLQREMQTLYAKKRDTTRYAVTVKNELMREVVMEHIKEVSLLTFGRHGKWKLT